MTDAAAKDDEERSTLCLAIQAQHVDVVKYLLTEGRFDVNERDNAQLTPLHHACKGNNAEIVKALLVDNVDLTARDVGGKTAVEMANDECKKVIVKFEMERKARLAPRLGGEQQPPPSPVVANVARPLPSAPQPSPVHGRVLLTNEATPLRCHTCHAADRQVDRLLLPCRHLCLCRGCAVKLKRCAKETKNCPMCAQKVKSIVTVYF